MMNLKRLLLFVFIFCNVDYVWGKCMVPVISTAPVEQERDRNTSNQLKYLPFLFLVEQGMDTSEYWRATEILSLIRNNEASIDFDRCEQSGQSKPAHFNSVRTVRPVCKSRIDFQLCPQCPHFNNYTECELFRDSCKEKKVHPSEYRSYCDQKYGKWRTMFLPADYSQCRCCDECIAYRELDQSCVEDVYSFETEEFLPVTTIDFRAGCNTYWGHPKQEFKALRCDKILRRCVPITVPKLPMEHLSVHRTYHYEAPTSDDCPISCRGFDCPKGLVMEEDCNPGGFVPDKDLCNCCGKCSVYHQLGEKCAEYKKTYHAVNGSLELEVEEEFLEPGCDDGLVCRQGHCQDIHAVPVGPKARRDDKLEPYEPCKRELKYFKKKYGPEGHLHYNAPQCTPLWLYAPVQCRRFACYCALEDGTFIDGIKVPRVEVSNMNCDCAREKCRMGSDVECDGYGNYKEAMFARVEDETWLAEDTKKALFLTSPKDTIEGTTTSNET